MKKLIIISAILLSLQSYGQGMIQVDSSRLIVQSLDSNNKETGYISYYSGSDRYTTRGTVKQAVKKLYYFCLQGLEMASVTVLFSMALNENGTIKDQTMYLQALTRLKQIKQRYGL